MVNFFKPLRTNSSLTDEVSGTPQQDSQPQVETKPSKLRRFGSSFFNRRNLIDNKENNLSSKNDETSFADFNQAKAETLSQANTFDTKIKRDDLDSFNVTVKMEDEEKDEEEKEKEENLESGSLEPSAAEKPFNRERYYRQALTDNDKHALAIGEKQPGAKDWTMDDVIRMQKSRLDTLHPGIPAYKEFVEVRRDEVEEAEQALGMKKQQKQNRFSGLLTPRITLTPADAYPLRLTSQSEADLHQALSVQRNRSSEAPPLPPLPPSFLSQASQGEEVPGHVRAVSTGDISQRRSRIRPGPPRRIVSSPLAVEVQPYEVKPEVTFDKFLSPHASGKGEAYRGAANAKKEGSPRKGSTNKLSKRLSKISSFSALRKGKSSQGSTTDGDSTE
jgi:predicted protein tyrosine phosphatase